MAGLVLLHGVIYQQLESRSVYYVVVLLGLFMIALLFQITGFLAYDRGASTMTKPPPPLSK
jgi:hypothetical protein